MQTVISEQNPTKNSVNPEDFFNEEVYWRISRAYTKLVLKYFGRIVRFQPPLQQELDRKEYRKRKKRFVLTAFAKKKRGELKRIQKLIRICADLDIQFNVYMERQFKELAPDCIRYRRPKYLTFGYLISDKASERFKATAPMEEKNRTLSGYVRKSEKPIVDIETSIRESVRWLHERLSLAKARGVKINASYVCSELERLVKAGYVGSLYLCISPVVEKAESDYLQEMKRRGLEKFSDRAIEGARVIKEKLNFISGGFNDYL